MSAREEPPRLRARVWGHASAPTTIVLLHGFSGSARWWDGVGELLGTRHRLLSVDLLGHGDSPRSPLGYAIDIQARAVLEALARSETAEAILVGHSMGGHVAIELAGLAPERVRGIVAVDMPPRLPGNDIGALARLALLPGVGDLARVTAPPALARRAMATLFAPGFPPPSRLQGDPRRMARDSYAQCYRGMLEYMQAGRSVGERLGEIPAPKLVIWGELDRIWPLAHGREMAAGARARFLEVPGAGHSPQIEAPELVAGAIGEFASSLNALPDRFPARSRRPSTAAR